MDNEIKFQLKYILDKNIKYFLLFLLPSIIVTFIVLVLSIYFKNSYKNINDNMHILYWDQIFLNNLIIFMLIFLSSFLNKKISIVIFAIVTLKFTFTYLISISMYSILPVIVKLLPFSFIEIQSYCMSLVLSQNHKFINSTVIKVLYFIFSILILLVAAFLEEGVLL